MLYTVKITTNTTEKTPKNPLHMVFFVITKKAFKKAVDRNRVKRRARKAFMDAFSSIQQDVFLTALQKKRIIFYLERDMIHEVYSHIVLQMKNDLSKLIKKHV